MLQKLLLIDSNYFSGSIISKRNIISSGCIRFSFLCIIAIIIIATIIVTTSTAEKRSIREEATYPKIKATVTSSRFFEEETPERVWNIDFEGNETYSGLNLRNIIALEAPSIVRKLLFWDRSGFEFDETELQRDRIRIERFYQRRGFPHVRVTSEVEKGRRDWSRRVIFRIDEGEPTLIDSVRYEIHADDDMVAYLEEQREFQRAQRRHPMQKDERYQLLQHSDVEGAMLSVLRNLGFAHADAFATATVDTTGKSAEVLITLIPGPLSFIGDILVDGNQTVPEDVVLRQSGLKTGDMYRSTDLRSAQQEIFGHPLFRFATVNMPPQPPDSVVDISIRVREHALRSVRVQGGFGIEEIVRLSVSWEHRNPFGNAHKFSATTRASFLEQRVNLDYYIPYVFNPKSRINISPFGQRVDERGYLLVRGGITNSFIYQISREAAATVSYEFTRNREWNNRVDVDDVDRIRPEEEPYYNISALQLSGYYDKLEVERYQGWVIRPYAEFSGFLGTGALQYNRYIMDLRRYIDVGPGTQFAMRNEAGLITFTGLDALPYNVRFYAGGTASVRGWQRRELGPKRVLLDEEGNFAEYIPIGGKAMYTFNLEIRQELNQLIRRFGVAFFLDGGAVWENPDDARIEDMQFGLGGGFRYNSPIGPIRIDLARKLNPTDEDLNIYNGEDFGGRFDHWSIHFSIGHAF